MATLWQDVRYGLRLLARSPGFTAIVVLVLAVGIGANTAMFSVVNTVMLRPLPYTDPDRIVTLWAKNKDRDTTPISQNFKFLREHNQSFEYLAGYVPAFFYVTGIDRPQQCTAWSVSPNLFPLLGVQPLLGRTFLPHEEQPGNERVVVLSHGFWRDQLGGTPEILGKTLGLEEEDYMIVGIMPPEFRWPARSVPSVPFWVPLVPREYGPVAQIARLKKGITVKQARAEMAVLTGRLREMEPYANAELTTGVDRLLEAMLKSSGRLLWLMLGAAACVLLIACGNVANLFLARAGVRQREVAMRVALGASRPRVVRQMLTESLVLSAAAGLLGFLMAFWGVKALVGLCPLNIPRLRETHIDVSVLLFTLGLSVLTGLVFGLLPAWRASDVRTAETLKDSGAQPGSGRGWRHIRGGLVVAQIGVSLVLLMGAGLLIRTLIALQSVDLGFQPRNVLTVAIDLPRVKYPEPHHCKAFFEPLLQQVRALPGVRAASLAGHGLGLASGGGSMPIWIDDQQGALEDRPDARRLTVSPGFFEAMGIRVLRGRTITDRDVQAGARCVVIDENLARTYFPGVDPIGHRVNRKTIIGVVSTLRDFQTLNPKRETFFEPLWDSYFQKNSLVVRAEGAPMHLAAAIRAQVAALDKDQAVGTVETLEATLSGMLAPRRFTMVLLSLFSAIALILAMVGGYGLLQYNTTQQIHDIGIRMALGARAGDVLRAVLVQGLRLTFLGIAVGLAGAFALTRILSSLVYGVTPADPLTFALVTLLLTGVALLASYLPARRAARIDPMVALRHE